MVVSQSDKDKVRQKLQCGEPIKARELGALIAVRNEDLPSPIWEDLIYPETRTVIYGLPKRHKTNFALNLTMAIASGQPLLHLATRQAKVLFLSGEQKEWFLAERCINILKAFPAALDNWQFRYLPVRDRNPQSIETLIKRYKSEVVVLDPLQQLIKPEKEEKQWRYWLDAYDTWIEQYKIALFLIHHSKKKNRLEPENLDYMTHDLRGFGLFAGWVNNMVCIVRQKPREKDIIQIGFECRDSKNPPDDMLLRFDRVNCLFTEDIEETEEAINCYLIEHYKQNCSKRQLISNCAQEVGCGEWKVWQIWNTLREHFPSNG